MNTPSSPRPAGGNSLALVAVAALMGLVTVGITFMYIAQIKKATQQSTVSVWVLNKDKEPGDKLNAVKDLREVRIPQSLRDGLAGAIVSREAVNTQHGQELTRKANQGEWLTLDMFSGDLAEGHKVEPGNVALAIPVNSRNNVPGLMRPGMFIDLIGTFVQPGQPPHSMWVIKKVRVIATGTNTNTETGRGASGYSAITIQTNSIDAMALLTISRHIGRDGFDVVIRNPIDQEIELSVNKEVKKLVGLR